MPERRDNITPKQIKLSLKTEETCFEITQEQATQPLTAHSSTQTSFEDEIIRLNKVIRVLENRVKCKNVQIIRLRTKLLRESSHHKNVGH